jgi:hypothetical protein
MSEDGRSPLQNLLAARIAQLDKPRDHYDSILRKTLETTGKPLWDVERGKVQKPSPRVLRAMEEALGYDPDYLVDFVHPRASPAAKPPAQRPPEADQPMMRKADEGTVSLKVVDLNLAMGDGGNLDDWADEESVEFDLNLLRSITRSPAARVIVVRPRGDSMFPTLLNGDWVLIDTTQRVLNLDDKIWACSVYGAGAVKRLKAIGKDKVEVRSDNPIAGNREVDSADLIILGRVIWIGREA